MLTKEELLQKGISGEVADEIIAAAATDSDPENSLQALEKALNNDDAEEGELFKAKGGEGKGKDGDDDDDDDEDEYDESYMKKYMKRYMKENKSAASSAAKEVGLFAGKMEKAVSDIDMNADGAMIEMADLKPILETQSEFNEKMAKAIENMSSAIEIIRAQHDQAFDFMRKAAAVQVETAKGLGEFLSTPQGRKGVTANVDMSKATKISSEDNKKVYTVLTKATVAGDKTAGYIISKFESAGKNINALNAEQRKYIHDLIQKEAN